MTTTFEQFVQSREHVADLREAVEDYEFSDEPVKGYVYLTYYHIAEDYVPGHRFYIPIGNCEYTFDDLSEAEKCLWENFVEGEENPV